MTLPLPYDTAEAARHLAAADPRLAALIARTGPLRLALKPAHSTFEALLESIIYQQLAGAAAAAILRRVRALFPAGQPTPERLLAMAEADLRGAGLSRGKAASLRDLARRSLDGTVPAFTELGPLSDADLIARLTAVRGVGPWTVHMLLIFRLGRPDVLPVGDFAIRKACGLLYGMTGPARAGQLLWRARRWKPYRSAACWYLWRLLELSEAERGLVCGRRGSAA